MYWARNCLEKWCTWLIQAQYFDSVADLKISVDKLAHSFWRTTVRWGETTDDVKYMQGRPRCRW